MQLVRDYVSRDTAEALAQLHAGTVTGDVVGIAFVAMLKGRRYITNVAGRCVREATATRGAVAALDDQLAELVHGRDPEETR